MACKELLLSPLQPWRSARVSLFSCLPSSHLIADTGQAPLPISSSRVSTLGCGHLLGMEAGLGCSLPLV